MGRLPSTRLPWSPFWLLTRTTDCRIFQDRTAPDIVKDIFREYGYIDCLSTLVQNYAL